jgi:hypothetical protein
VRRQLELLHRGGQARRVAELHRAVRTAPVPERAFGVAEVGALAQDARRRQDPLVPRAAPGRQADRLVVVAAVGVVGHEQPRGARHHAVHAGRGFGQAAAFAARHRRDDPRRGRIVGRHVHQVGALGPDDQPPAQLEDAIGRGARVQPGHLAQRRRVRCVDHAQPVRAVGDVQVRAAQQQVAHVAAQQQRAQALGRGRVRHVERQQPRAGRGESDAAAHDRPPRGLAAQLVDDRQPHVLEGGRLHRAAFAEQDAARLRSEEGRAEDRPEEVEEGGDRHDGGRQPQAEQGPQGAGDDGHGRGRGQGARASRPALSSC